MLLEQLGVDSSVVSPLALLPCDPARLDLIATFLDDFKIINQRREYRLGAGFYQGKKITVCSTGVGCPSTAVVAENLIKGGAKVLIRVGTCGGAWREEISEGSLIIPSAAVRDEGTTIEYIPLGFPAVADVAVVNSLVASAEKFKEKFFVGINRTHDAYFGANSVITKWGQYLLDERWRSSETPIVSSEMECSALFVVASLWGVKAGSVLAVNAKPEPLKKRLMGEGQKVVNESSGEVTIDTIKRAIKVSLEGLVNTKI